MPFASSCQTSLPNCMNPSDARSSPAKHLNNVVFPEPEGPNSTVMPDVGTSKSTLR